jgi:alpha-glucosidase
VSDWWRDAVCYQIYPRSFADSNGDGVGDLRGITAHLDHLEWLGIDAVWLSPTFPSPNADWGYDVADYCAVHPELGTMADLDGLIADAGRRGIRILLDLVPNHTSVAHPWFVAAWSSRDSEHRDWYVWADGRDGGPPNNWKSSFGGSAWEHDEQSGQWYLHNFLDSQADLNWWNPAVRDEFERILRFWFDRGVAGFRIDVAHMVVKDRELRDDPDGVALYSTNRPEVHELYRSWRGVADAYDLPRCFVGETFVSTVEEVAAYYGSNDELHLAFNIPFVHAGFDADELRTLVEETERLLPAGSSPVWTGSNHDTSRLVTRWAGEDAAKVRCALLMLLTLRGVAFLYYGDELGMPDTDIPDDRRLDPVSIALAPILDRDAARTPMPWTGDPGAGFTEPGVEPWLPFGDVAACNVADQRVDPSSTLHFTRDVIALRRETSDLRAGSYQSLAAARTLWAWRRGASVVVALNLGDEPSTLEGVAGSVRVATDRVRDGERVHGSLTLRAWEGAVVEISGTE